MSAKPRILVVEDNAVTRKMLRVTLETEGYAVIEAPDARVALASARARLPDLVLQDLILPDADGFELARQLRALPEGDQIPIVAVSGFVGHIDDARTTDAGFTALLVKPVEPTQLLECLERLLPKRRPSTAPGRDLAVLLVDDDAVQSKLLRVHLTQLGFRVSDAANAEQAMLRARRERPDVIVSDVLMPAVDGFQLCAALRRDPELSSVPVVLISSYYQAELDVQLAERVGANALVPRTPDLGELSPAILRAYSSGAPQLTDEPTDQMRLDHLRAVIRQLERQLTVNSGLARRCALQAAQLSLLGGIADALSRHTDPRVALHDVLAATLDAAAISKGALLLRGEDDGVLRLHDALGFSGSEVAELARFFGHEWLFQLVLADKVPRSVPSEEVPEAVADAILRGAGVVSAEIVPLVSEGNGVGAIVLGAKRSDVTNEESVVFARAIGNQIVQSLELERSFRRLSDSERRYRTVLEHAHDAISILTPEGTIREVNGRVVELLGLPREQIVGRSIHEFSVAGAGEGRGDGHAWSASPGPSSRVEFKKPDGAARFIEFSNAAIDVAGEELVIAIGRDVTDELRAQTQLLISDRMASIGMLAAGVAHEINNPLAVVVANLDLARQDLASEREKLALAAGFTQLEAELDDAREAAARVREIVRDLKIFSRAEQEQRAPVDVHRVLDSATRMAWNEIRHRAQLVKDYGDLPRVSANESRLGQVFLNLIVNAAQAIPEGHADTNQITIRTRASVDGGSVLVHVSDTGSGIPPEVLQKLFTPFFTTKPQGLGTGLGLTICHRLVTELGGDIVVESEFGRGTTFRVVLPATTAEVEQGATEKPAALHGRRGRVLVIDDENLVGVVVQRALTPAHDVVYLPTAEEAHRRIGGGERFDVIVCDLMMPIMTGMELYARLTREAPDQASRMVFLTGGAFTASAREFLENTTNARLEKPFDLDALTALIRERLR